MAMGGRRDELKPWRSLSFRLSLAFGGCLLLIEAANLATVPSLIVDTQREVLREHGEGLAAAATALMSTALELDAFEAGERAAAVLFADPVVTRLEVLKPGGVWLERSKAGESGGEIVSETEITR